MTTTTKPIRAALDQIPGYTQAVTAKATLARWTIPALPVDAATEALWAAARRGDPEPPPELGAMYAQQATTAHGLRDAFAAIRDARAEATAGVDEAVHAHPDRALAYLTARLDEVIAVVRDVDDRLPATVDAEAAVRAGGSALDAWKLLAAAVEDYDEIRTVQWDVVRRASRPDHLTDITQLRTAWLRTGLLADGLDYENAWVDRRAVAAGATLEAGSDGALNWLANDTYRPVINPPPPSVLLAPPGGRPADVSGPRGRRRSARHLAARLQAVALAIDQRRPHLVADTRPRRVPAVGRHHGPAMGPDSRAARHRRRHRPRRDDPTWHSRPSADGLHTHRRRFRAHRAPPRHRSHRSRRSQRSRRGHQGQPKRSSGLTET
ncbi:hypothetical protein [Cellulomonas sp. P24]|uniref:hypothetical protein n=1 Tax=Cellulomonas sp. P24 TaxID=2885206 RepID=UPI00216B3EF3|nr:hypothetical protein [Cellulomonas sp. P24]MCR6494241.1 hypothetical protein [Cellulomonas sp. P24]